MVTSSGALTNTPSLTTRRNTIGTSVSETGVVHVIDASVTSSHDVVGPATCVHSNASGVPFGSADALPSSTICTPGAASRSTPATATGGALPASVIVTSTKSGCDVSLPSSTTRLNTSVADAAGAMSCGAALVSSSSTTAVPPICCQRDPSASSSGSEEPVPSRVTSVPSTMTKSTPASATGGSFSASRTVMSTT